MTDVDTDVKAPSPDDASAGQRSRFGPLKGATQGLLLLAFLVVIVIFFTSRDPSFLTAGNALNILSNASVIGIVSLGQVLTIISGGFDLSVSGTVPLGGILFALLVNQGRPVWLAILLVLAAGAVCGLVNGLVVSLARINPLIATLGTMSVTAGLALTLSGGVQIPFTDPASGVLADQPLFGVSNHVWILVGLSVILFLFLRYTVFGRYLYAVGGNREAARLAGIRVNGVTTAVYIASAALATLAGAVLASQLFTGSGTAGTNSALQSIAAVILGGAALSGGVGGVPGTLIGVLILGTLSNGMAILSVPSFYQTITTGVVLLLAVGVSQLRTKRHHP